MNALHGLASGPLPNYNVIAKSIRDAAGIPSSETTGYRETPGLTGATLTDKNGSGTLASAAGVAGAADGGTGTSADPYLFSNYRFDNSEGIPTCFNFTGSDTYTVKFVNCWFSGYDTGGIATSATNNTIIAENCLFTYDDGTGDPSDANTSHVMTNAGSSDIILNACAATSGGRAFARGLNFAGTITLNDCLMDDTDASWTGIAALFECSSDATYTANYCTVNSTNGSLDFTVRILSASTVVLNNCDIDGNGNDGGAWVGVVSAGTIAADITIQYCDFSGNANTGISIVTCGTVDIGYCDMATTTNNRQVYFNGTSNLDFTSGRVHHCKLTGTGSSELLYSLQAENITFDENYAVSTGEDAFEHVRSRPGNQVLNSVCDSAVGQIVDIFDVHATDPGTAIVRGIYGACQDVGVIVTGNNTAHVSNIHIETASDAVALEQRDVLSATGPTNCRIFGPIENSLGDKFGTITGTGALGTGNTIGGVVGVNSI